MPAPNLDYWFVFPVAIPVAAIANASGFSGGVLADLFIFSRAPGQYLRLIVGLVVGTVAIQQLLLAWRGRVDGRPEADLEVLARDIGGAHSSPGASPPAREPAPARPSAGPHDRVYL